jgi:hypothetical protein
MDNQYAIESLVHDNLREARAEAARHRATAEYRQVRRTIRVRIGAALILLGERLAHAQPNMSDHIVRVRRRRCGPWRGQSVATTLRAMLKLRSSATRRRRLAGR